MEQNSEYENFIANTYNEENLVSNVPPRRGNFYKQSQSSEYHIRQAEDAIKALKYTANRPGWKKVMTNKRGTVVYTKPGTMLDNKVPVYMGEHEIVGFTPQAIFTVIGMRKPWDDWYEGGHLVDNLNDTTSTTYMVMHALVGSKDLSLVEKIECTPTGEIYFAATSVDNPKVPHVSGRIRAEMILTGWILEPLSSAPPRTRVIYINQVNVNGWPPKFLVSTVMSRRSFVLCGIEDYLIKHDQQIISTMPQDSPPNDSPKFSAVDSPKLSAVTSPKLSAVTSPKLPAVTSPKLPAVTSPKLSAVTSPKLSTVSSPKLSSVSSPKLSPKLSSASSPILSPKLSSEGATIPEDPKYIPLDSNVLYEKPKSKKINDKNILPLIPLDSSQAKTSQRSMSTTSSSLSPIEPPPMPALPLPILPLSSPHVSPKSLINQSLKKDRHKGSANNVLYKLKTLASNLDGWEFYKEEQGIDIYTREGITNSMPMTRGDIKITGRHKPEDILSIISELEMRKLWDDRFDEGVNIERLGQNEFLTKLSMKRNFPISRRDLATVCIIEHDPETGTIWHASTSVADPLIPESKKHVRANLAIAGWQIRPRVDEELTTYIEITYITDIDIRLETIPPSIIKTVFLQPPLCIAKVVDILKKIGHPPYVKNTSGLIISEEINVKTYQYDLAIEISNDRVTDIKTSKIMYPNGFDVSVAPEESQTPLNENSSINGVEDNEISNTDSADSTLVSKDNDVYERDDFQLKHLKAAVTSPKITATDQLSQQSEGSFESVEFQDESIVEQNFFKSKNEKNKEEESSSEQEIQLKGDIMPIKFVTYSRLSYTPESKYRRSSDFFFKDYKSNRKSYNSRGGIYVAEIDELQFKRRKTSIMFVLMLFSFYVGKGIGYD
ncbi:11472_t:CDS:10 [Dentiscutata heterogama]|uniref:11472_t:CDS:1 n=1 Tax=Dentiscutata heterogama TaxID=1316150 RepID=A0ACA9KHV2_9GLOM|nr:11472_t:CDS:10 [Dentiscutata heterogama]